MDGSKLLILAGLSLLLLGGEAAGGRWRQATTSPPRVLKGDWRKGFRLLSGGSPINDSRQKNNEQLGDEKLPTIRNNHRPADPLPPTLLEKDERRFIPTLSRTDFGNGKELVKEASKDIESLQVQPMAQKPVVKNVTKIIESSPLVQGSGRSTRNQFVKEETPAKGSSSPLPLLGERTIAEKLIMDGSPITESSFSRSGGSTATENQLTEEPALEAGSSLTKPWEGMRSEKHHTKEMSRQPQSSQSQSVGGSHQNNQQWDIDEGSSTAIPGPLFDSKRHLIREASVIARRIKGSLNAPDDATLTVHKQQPTTSQNYNKDDDKHMIRKAIVLTKKLKTILNGRVRNRNLTDLVTGLNSKEPQLSSFNFNNGNLTLKNITKQQHQPELHTSSENSILKEIKREKKLNNPKIQRDEVTKIHKSTDFRGNSLKSAQKQPIADKPKHEPKSNVLEYDSANKNKTADNKGHNQWNQPGKAGENALTDEYITIPRAKEETGDETDRTPLNNNHNVGSSHKWEASNNNKSRDIGIPERTSNHSEPISVSEETPSSTIRKWDSSSVDWKNSIDKGKRAWYLGTGDHRRTPNPLESTSSEVKMPINISRDSQLNPPTFDVEASVNHESKITPRSGVTNGNGGSITRKEVSGYHDGTPDGSARILDSNAKPKENPRNVRHNLTGSDLQEAINTKPKGERIGKNPNHDWKGSTNNTSNNITRSGELTGNGMESHGRITNHHNPVLGNEKSPKEGKQRHLNLPIFGRGDPNHEKNPSAPSDGALNEGNEKHNLSFPDLGLKRIHALTELSTNIDKMPNDRMENIRWSSPSIDGTSFNESESKIQAGTPNNDSIKGEWYIPKEVHNQTLIHQDPDSQNEKIQIENKGNIRWSSPSLDGSSFNRSEITERAGSPNIDNSKWKGSKSEVQNLTPKRKDPLPMENKEKLWLDTPSAEGNTSLKTSGKTTPKVDISNEDKERQDWNIPDRDQEQVPSNIKKNSIIGKRPTMRNENYKWNATSSEKIIPTSKSENTTGTDITNEYNGRGDWNYFSGSPKLLPTNTTLKESRETLSEDRGLSRDENLPNVVKDTSQKNENFTDSTQKEGPDRKSSPEGNKYSKIPDLQWNTSQNRTEYSTATSGAPIENSGKWRWDLGTEGTAHKEPVTNGGELPESSKDWKLPELEFSTPPNTNAHNMVLSGTPKEDSGSRSWNLGSERAAPELTHKEPVTERQKLLESSKDWKLPGLEFSTPKNIDDHNMVISGTPREDSGSSSWNLGSERAAPELTHKEPVTEREILPESSKDWKLPGLEFSTPQNIDDHKIGISGTPRGDSGSSSWNLGSERAAPELTHKEPVTEREKLPESSKDWKLPGLEFSTPQNIDDHNMVISGTPRGDSGSSSWNLGSERAAPELTHKEPVTEREKLPESSKDWKLPGLEFSSPQNIDDHNRVISGTPREDSSSSSWNLESERADRELTHKEPVTEREKLPETSKDGKILNLEWDTPQNTTDHRTSRSGQPSEGGESWSWVLGSIPGRQKSPVLRKDWKLPDLKWNTPQNTKDHSTSRSGQPSEGGDSWSWDLGSIPDKEKSPELRKDWKLPDLEWNTQQNTKNHSTARSGLPSDGGDSWSWDLGSIPDKEKSPELRKDWKIPDIGWNTPQNTKDQSTSRSGQPSKGGDSWSWDLGSIPDNEKSPELRKDWKLPDLEWNTPQNAKDHSTTRTGQPSEGGDSWSWDLGSITDKEKSPELRKDWKLPDLKWNTPQNAKDHNTSRSEQPSKGGDSWSWDLGSIAAREKSPELRNDWKLTELEWNTPQNTKDHNTSRSEQPSKGGDSWSWDLGSIPDKEKPPELRKDWKLPDLVWNTPQNTKDHSTSRSGQPSEGGDSRSWDLGSIPDKEKSPELRKDWKLPDLEWRTPQNTKDQNTSRSGQPSKGGDSWRWDLGSIPDNEKSPELRKDWKLPDLEWNTPQNAKDHSTTRTGQPSEGGDSWSWELGSIAAKEKSPELRKDWKLPDLKWNTPQNTKDRSTSRSEKPSKGGDSWSWDLRSIPDIEKSPELRKDWKLPDLEWNTSQNTKDHSTSRSEQPSKGGDSRSWDGSIPDKEKSPELRKDWKLPDLEWNTPQKTKDYSKSRSGQPSEGGYSWSWDLGSIPDREKSPELSKDWKLPDLEWRTPQNTKDRSTARSGQPSKDGDSWSWDLGSIPDREKSPELRKDWKLPDLEWNAPQNTKDHSTSRSGQPSEGGDSWSWNLGSIPDREKSPELRKNGKLPDLEWNTPQNTKDHSMSRAEQPSKGGDSWSWDLGSIPDKVKSPELKKDWKLPDSKWSASLNTTQNTTTKSGTTIDGSALWRWILGSEAAAPEPTHTETLPDRDKLPESFKDTKLPDLDSKARSELPNGGGDSWSWDLGSIPDREKSPELSKDWKLPDLEWRTPKNTKDRSTARSGQPSKDGDSWSWDGSIPDKEKSPELRKDWKLPDLEWNTPQNTKDHSKSRSGQPSEGGYSWSWDLGSIPDREKSPELSKDWKLPDLEWRTPQNTKDRSTARSGQPSKDGDSWSWDLGSIPDREKSPELRKDWKLPDLEWNAPQNTKYHSTSRSGQPSEGGDSWSWNLGSIPDREKSPELRKNWKLPDLELNTPQNTKDHSTSRSGQPSEGGDSWSWDLGSIPDKEKTPELSKDWKLPDLKWNTPQNTKDHSMSRAEQPSKGGDSWSWDLGSIPDKVKSPELKKDWKLPDSKWSASLNTTQNTTTKSGTTIDGSVLWRWILGSEAAAPEPTHTETLPDRDKLPESFKDTKLPDLDSKARSELPNGGGGSWSWDLGSIPDREKLPELSKDWKLPDLEWRTPKNTKDRSTARSGQPSKDGDSWSWDLGSIPDKEKSPELRKDWKLPDLEWNTPQNAKDHSTSRSGQPSEGGDSWSWNLGSIPDREKSPELRKDWKLPDLEWNTPQNTKDHSTLRSGQPSEGGDSWSWDLGSIPDREKSPELRKDWKLPDLEWHTPQNTKDHSTSRSGQPSEGGDSWSWNLGSIPDREKSPDLSNDWKLPNLKWSASLNTTQNTTTRSGTPIHGSALWRWILGSEAAAPEPTHTEALPDMDKLPESFKDTKLPDLDSKARSELPNGGGGSWSWDLVSIPDKEKSPELSKDWKLPNLEWNTPHNTKDHSTFRTEQPSEGGDSWSWDLGSKPDKEKSPELRKDWKLPDLEWNTPKNTKDHSTSRSGQPSEGGDSWSWDLGPIPDREKSPELRKDWKLPDSKWNTPQNTKDRSTARSGQPSKDGDSWSWDLGSIPDREKSPELRKDWKLPDLEWHTPQNTKDHSTSRSGQPSEGGDSWSWNLGSIPDREKSPDLSNDWKLPNLKWSASLNTTQNTTTRSGTPIHGSALWRWILGSEAAVPEPTHTEALPDIDKLPESFKDTKLPDLDSKARSELPNGGGGSWSWDLGSIPDKEKSPELSKDWKLPDLEWRTPKNTKDRSTARSGQPSKDGDSWSWDLGSIPAKEKSPELSKDWKLPDLEWNTPHNTKDHSTSRSEQPSEGGDSWSWDLGSIPDEEKSPELSKDWKLPDLEWNTPQNTKDRSTARSGQPSEGGDSRSWDLGSIPDKEKSPELSKDWKLPDLEWRTPQNTKDHSTARSGQPSKDGDSWSWDLGSIPDKEKSPELSKDWKLPDLEWRTPQNTKDHSTARSGQPSKDGDSWSWDLGSIPDKEKSPELSKDWKLPDLEWRTPQNTKDHSTARSGLPSKDGDSWSWDLGSIPDKEKSPELSKDWKLPDLEWNTPQNTKDHSTARSGLPSKDGDSWSWDLGSIPDKEKSLELRKDWKLPDLEWNTPQNTKDHSTARSGLPSKDGDSWSWNTPEVNRDLRKWTFPILEWNNAQNNIDYIRPRSGTINDGSVKQKWSSNSESPDPPFTSSDPAPDSQESPKVSNGRWNWRSPDQRKEKTQNNAYEILSRYLTPDDGNRLLRWILGSQGTASRTHQGSGQENRLTKNDNIDQLEEAPIRREREVRFRLGGAWVPGAEPGVSLTSLRLESPGGGESGRVLTLRQPALGGILRTDFGRALSRYFTRTPAPPLAQAH